MGPRAAQKPSLCKEMCHCFSLSFVLSLQTESPGQYLFNTPEVFPLSHQTTEIHTAPMPSFPKHEADSVGLTKGGGQVLFQLAAPSLASLSGLVGLFPLIPEVMLFGSGSPSWHCCSVACSDSGVLGTRRHSELWLNYIHRDRWNVLCDLWVLFPLRSAKTCFLKSM